MSIDVKLVPVDESNYQACLALTVTEAQKSFVASNSYSLVQAYIHRETAKPFAICAGEEIVGFAMVNVDTAKNDFYLWRYMIDQRYQNKGYGKMALRLVIDFLRELGATEIGLDYAQGNDVAERLYRGFGFMPTGEMDGDEIVMKLVL